MLSKSLFVFSLALALLAVAVRFALIPPLNGTGPWIALAAVLLLMVVLFRSRPRALVLYATIVPIALALCGVLIKLGVVSVDVGWATPSILLGYLATGCLVLYSRRVDAA